MLQNASVLDILTCKCALRHSGVRFLDICSSKSGPYPSVFSHFHLQMCFAPQRRAILEHRNFKNGSDTEVFSAFWLANVLRATAACHFLTSELAKAVPPWGVLCILTCKCALRHSGVPFSGSQLQKWLRPWGVLSILTYKRASRHSGVPFFTCLLNSYLRTRRFSEATLQEPRIIEKTQRFSVSLTFRARVPAFYWPYTRVDLLSADLTSLLCLTPLLCFSTLHIVGS